MKTLLQDYLLRQFPAFSSSEIVEITRFFVFKEVKRGDFLLVEGQKVALYFVNYGLLRVFDVYEDKERTFDFIRENSFGTLMKSFITNSPSAGFLEVLEDTQLCLISHADFNYLTRTIPAFALWYTRFLEQYLLEFFHCSDTLHNELLPLKTRYEQLLRHPFFSPDFLARLSDKMIASFLFVRPETFSRFKKTLL